MKSDVRRKVAIGLSVALSLFMAACGGGSGSKGGGGSGSSMTTPTVTVSANPSSITTAQSTTVTISVSGSNGVPSGSVSLTMGMTNLGSATLTSGSAQITIAAGKMATGTDMLTAAYTPDSSSSSMYNSAMGTGSVMVTSPTMITPTVTVLANPSSITTAEGTTVTVTVAGASGNPTPTGTVTLTSGSTSLGSATLSGGSATIPIAAGMLAAGTDTLTAAYKPDSSSSATYNSATGTGSVTVNTTSTQLTPTVTAVANPSSISSSQSAVVTVTVSGGSGNPTPTGSVTLTSGSYNSGAVTLSSGSATITVQGSALPAGNDLVIATYTPDTNSSSTYTTAKSTVTIMVTVSLAITSFTANPSTIPVGSTSTQLTAVFTGGTGVITPGNLSVTSNTPVTVSPTTTTVYTLTVTPSSGTAITQTLTVTLQSGITVNPASPGIAVTNQILGLNMAMWYDFTANTSTIVSAFKGAGIVALRWPGGSSSDNYHWDGAATSNPPNGTAPAASSCNNTYFNPNTNYLNFINDLESAASGGYDIALTADYGTNAACSGGGSPQEAANWVAYAYANGGTVSHVTVGNEEYGNWETDMHTVQHDPTTYASAVAGANGYYTLIKNANSNTLVGVDVDANCTTSNGCTNGWDSTVLSNAKGYYDFVEYHFYPQNPGSENDTTLLQQAPQEFTTNIKTIEQELSTAGETNTPIYVGEIGSVSSNPGKQSWSITQGLYAGQILGEMMNDGISRATWWIGFGNCNGTGGNDSSSLYGWQSFGAYNIFSDGSQDTACNYGGNAEANLGVPSPTAIAYQLFSNVAVNGEHVLTPTVAGDTTNVRVYAATHSGGTALVLFNLNETASAPVTITVTGKSSSPGVTEYTYNKEMYDYTDTNCANDLTCTVDPNHDYSNIDWVTGPTTTTMGTQTLPMTVTLAPWSMNVFLIQ